MRHKDTPAGAAADSPFAFAEKSTDPTGRAVRPVVATAAVAAAASAVPVVRRRRRRKGEAEPDAGRPVEVAELLKRSIREVIERQIRTAATEEDLTALLLLSLDDVRRRREDGLRSLAEVSQ